MRTVSAILIPAIAILISSCGHHSEISDFGAALYSATSDMTSAIDRSPSAGGVSQAYDGFKKEQGQLSEKWGKLLGKRLTAEDKSGLSDAVMASREKLIDCFNNHTAELRSNPRFYQAMGALRTDLENSFNVDDIH
jgi:hypothetical protein